MGLMANAGGQTREKTENGATASTCQRTMYERETQRRRLSQAPHSFAHAAPRIALHTAAPDDESSN